METKKANKSFQYYMRATHRVLGYLTLGLVMVYALSGITLIRRTGDFLKADKAVEVTLAPGLSGKELGDALKIRNFEVTNESDDVLYFANGEYNRTTGVAAYTKREVVSPMSQFIELHRLPDAKNPHIAWVTTTFGIILFLLALTSLFMYKVSNRQFMSNMAFTAIGVIITVILVMML